MRRPGRQRIERIELNALGATGQAVQPEQITEGQCAKPSPGALQEFAARADGQDVAGKGVRSHEWLHGYIVTSLIDEDKLVRIHEHVAKVDQSCGTDLIKFFRQLRRQRQLSSSTHPLGDDW